MLLARILAGIAQGSAMSTIFAYYDVSFVKYTEDLKILGKFEEKKAAKLKGYLFGFLLGNVIGVGMSCHNLTSLLEALHNHYNFTRSRRILPYAGFRPY